MYRTWYMNSIDVQRFTTINCSQKETNSLATQSSACIHGWRDLQEQPCLLASGQFKKQHMHVDRMDMHLH